MKIVNTCNHCGGTNVYADAWVSLNNPGELLGPYDTYHCEDCEGKCSITDVQVVEIPTHLVRDAIEYARNATLENDQLPLFVTKIEEVIEEQS